MNNKVDIRSQITWLKIFILITIFVFSFISALSLLVNTWVSRDEYSHGFLVPFISLYFIWANRERLKELPIQPNKAIGMFLIITSCFMLITGKIGSMTIVQEVSVLIVIPGLVLMLLGTKYLRALALPLAYLVFMVPVFDVVFDRIQWPFQLLSASMSVKFLELLGIPVVLDTQYIVLPKLTLEVAKECSGISFLISIMAIAIPLAYFSLREWWLRCILFVFAIIIAITTNWLRVVFIALWSINAGKVLHGPYHILQGLFVSVIGIIFLIITAWILSVIFPYNPSQKLNNSTIDKDVMVKGLPVDMKQVNRALFIAIVFFLGVGCYMHFYKPKPVFLETSINELPITIGDWRGKDLNHNYSKPFVIQGVDSEIMRLYWSSSGREVKLYIGYFESQGKGKELVSYKTQMLYENSEAFEVPINANSSIMVNRTVLTVGMQRFLLLSFYDLNGQIVANRYMVKFVTVINGLLSRQTNGAIIVVYSELKHSDELNKVFDDEVQFVQEVATILGDYFPKL